jgi:hypothetical protein
MAARATVTPCSSLLGSGGSSSTLYLHTHNDHVHILYVGGWSVTAGGVSVTPGSRTFADSFHPTTFSWRVVIPASGRFHLSIVAAHVSPQILQEIFSTITIISDSLSPELQVGPSVIRRLKCVAPARSTARMCRNSRRRRSTCESPIPPLKTHKQRGFFRLLQRATCLP